MKQANNNEMDLLLRSLARPQKDRSLLTNSLLEDQTDSPHLDADELSAYAERTLPAATRARYTMHLADCAQCRKIVAELAPVVAASTREHGEDQAATSLWQTVRHFFSWPVLRFAVPALSLLAFVVVGLVMFRDWSGGLSARRAAAPQADEIAQNQPAQTPQAETDAQKGTAVFDSNSTLDAEHQAKAKPEARTGAAKTDATTPAEAPAVNLSKDAGEAKPAPTVAQPTYAPEPAGAPAPKTQDRVAEVRRETAAQTEAAARPQSSAARDQRTDTTGFQTSGDRAKEEERARANAEIRAKAKDKQAEADKVDTDAPAQNRAAKLHTLQAGRGEGAGKKEDDEAAEVRSVAGRRFLRKGGMWVDSAYKSGISLTHVARGSEQYRGLIADEPAIRTVAEQLQGEVILIWKGRGYRIR